MSSLTIFICENYYLEFEKVIEREGYSDVFVKTFSCLCEDPTNKALNQKLLDGHTKAEETNVLLCSRHCLMNQLIPSKGSFKVRQSEICFNHLANDNFIQEIIANGAYIISLYWLQHWQQRVEKLGFDAKTAKCFYQEFAKKLVFFDAGIDLNAKTYLEELSAFLEIPYEVISIDLEFVTILLRSLVYEWRFHEEEKKNSGIINDSQAQCAEYASILDLMGKVASFTNKRDTIEKAKQLFMMVLGAQSFKYWSHEQLEYPLEIKLLLENKDQIFIQNEAGNRFFIKLKYNECSLGFFEVGDFLFPQYFERYLNFAIEIGNITSLVLTNIEQYEKLIKSENELQYLSYHDGLTGLYNRNYVNEYLSGNIMKNFLTIFMFDIDGLKFVNDTFGHLEGDKLISGASQVIKKCFRETDIVARIGGDEFMAILPDCELEKAEGFKKRLLSLIKDHNDTIEEDCLKLSLSSGFAVTKNKVETIEKLMQKADALMYQEKRNRKNCPGKIDNA